MAVVLQPEQHWVCQHCDLTDVTHEARPHSRMHPCRGLKGLTTPMVPDGVRCKVETHEREDYEGEDHGYVRHDGEGRPIMNVTVEREDGFDCFVYAPTAHADLREMR